MAVLDTVVRGLALRVGSKLAVLSTLLLHELICADPAPWLGIGSLSAASSARLCGWLSRSNRRAREFWNCGEPWVEGAADGAADEGLLLAVFGHVCAPAGSWDHGFAALRFVGDVFMKARLLELIKSVFSGSK